MAGSGACQILPPFYNLKRGKIALQPPNLENTVKITFSIKFRKCLATVQNSKQCLKRKINKNHLKAKIKRVEVVN